MSETSGKPNLFLERRSYRRRRLIDLVRLAPVIGLVLFMMPLLWAGNGSTSGGMMYIFAVWAGLIVLMALLARPLIRALSQEDNDGPSDDREGL